MSTNQVTQFAERLASISSNIDSVMIYPHPFTDGGVVVIFDDTVDSYVQIHASVMQAAPPACEKHIRRRSDLFILSIPTYNNLAPYDYPHMVYYLKHQGKVLYGQDLRGEISLPVNIAPVLVTALDGTACWFRTHNILAKSQMREYASLLDDIYTRLRFLMATALLTRTGQWDVQVDRVPNDFQAAFADAVLSAAWNEFDAIRKRVIDQKEDWATTLRAIWLFEVFTRRLRRYA